MARVKIEDLKPEARNLDAKEMKKLFGGAIIIDENTLTAGTTLSTNIIPQYSDSLNLRSTTDCRGIPALTTNLGKF